MKLLVTGGCGFVLSNVVKRLMSTVPDASVVVLDTSRVDSLINDFFVPHSPRIRFLQGDVRNDELLNSLSTDGAFTHVIHGAAVTHDPDTERNDPRLYLGVNISGTVSILEWLRRQPQLQRYIHVSTGGVYGNPSPLSPVVDQPETGPFDPPELYAVSKYSAELIARRYGALFQLPIYRIRLADVFGPMERPTGARTSRAMSILYRMMRATIDGKPLLVSPETLESAADYLSAEDIALAIQKLLTAEQLYYDVYNISAGRRIPVVEILSTFGAVVPEFSYKVVDANKAEVHFKPSNRLARYNAYSIARIAELEWQPRSLQEQIRSYVSWVVQDPGKRCPRLNFKAQ